MSTKNNIPLVSRVIFCMIETRPSVDIKFWDLIQCKDELNLVPTFDFDTTFISVDDNEISKTICQQIGRPNNKRVPPLADVIYTKFLYHTTILSFDQLTQTTLLHYAKINSLIELFNDASFQNDYWQRHLYNKENNISFTKDISSFRVNNRYLLSQRPPGDQFTFDLFLELTENTRFRANCLYLWSSFLGIDNQYEMEVKINILKYIKEDLVILGIKDHLTPDQFNPWTEDRPGVAIYLQKLFEHFHKKQFILLTSMEKLDTYITNDNVSIVSWGGDITNHANEYKTLDPVSNKNFDSEFTFLTLNRNPRHHRALSVSLLYGLGLESFGLISCMFDLPGLVNNMNWIYSDNQIKIRDIIDLGATLFDPTKLKITDDRNIYTIEHNDNVSNFKNKLRSYYENTFVELIAETSFTEASFLITEKTLNSIYGCNFPIWLSSVGVVTFLREIGLDTFDDIIDHSYDLIENPIDRLYHAIADNKELLTNLARTKQLWFANQERFIKNVDFVKHDMYDIYSNRAKTNFKLALDKLS